MPRGHGARQRYRLLRSLRRKISGVVLRPGSGAGRGASSLIGPAAAIATISPPLTTAGAAPLFGVATTVPCWTQSVVVPSAATHTENSVPLGTKDAVGVVTTKCASLTAPVTKRQTPAATEARN